MGEAIARNKKTLNCELTVQRSEEWRKLSLTELSPCGLVGHVQEAVPARLLEHLGRQALAQLPAPLQAQA